MKTNLKQCPRSLELIPRHMKTTIFFVQANVGAIRKMKVVHDHEHIGRLGRNGR